MSSLRRTRLAGWCGLVVLTVLVGTGCINANRPAAPAAWYYPQSRNNATTQGLSQNDPVDAARQALSSAPITDRTAASHETQSVVRFQNYEYAPRSSEHLRGPLLAAGTPPGPAQNQWVQYEAPIPANPWSSTPPPPATSSPATAPNWGSPSAPPTVQNWGQVPQTQSAPVWTNGQPPMSGTAWPNPTTPGVIQSAPPTGTAWGPPVLTQTAPQQVPSPVWGPPVTPGAPLPGVMASPMPPPGTLGVPTPLTDIIVNVQEAQTGRLSFGAAVNSDAGLTGQIVLEEKNFDWRRVPTSWNDWANGTAFRGAGQGLRIEALPGSQVQRYMVQFTEPYFLDTYWSFNVSGFLFDRNYFDWNEQRLGGRFGFGYRVTPDLSLQVGMRLEEVEISDIRLPGAAPDLDDVAGSHELYSGRISLTQDTRDIPFAPTQGYYFEVAFEQVFGSFDYPRGSIDWRRYFLVTERPDGSGRHVLGFASKVFMTGSNTPVFENFFAGGYSTLRGFEFRGASPLQGGISVGGELMMLGSVEYRFPVTADDMLQGVVFCDYGTVEERMKIEADDYRVSLGAGLRIAIPAMSAAPIALDFSIPVARESTDQIQNFAFWVGVSR